METPLHPFIVHFPMALAFILPLLVIVMAFMIKAGKLPYQSWALIIGLQVVTTATGYVALETGETDEERVSKLIDKKFVQAHEEAAEIFVGSTVLALVFSVASFFLRKEMQFMVQMVVLLVSLGSTYLAYNTGHLGGEIVYVHLAQKNPPALDGLLPTPGQNTSESPEPVEENESLRADDNDYGNSDEEPEIEDEASKQED